MRCYLSITLFFLFSAGLVFFTNAQNPLVDSLEKVLKTTPDDTNKVKILDDLCWEYNMIDAKKAEAYGQQLLALSQKIKYKKGEGNGYSSLGASNYVQNKYAEAVTYFEKAAEIRRAINDKPGTGGALNNIAMVRQQQGDYPTAINYYLQALKIFEELNDEKRMAFTTGNIGALYVETKNFSVALKYSQRSLEIWEKLKNNRGVASGYINIGNCYNGLKKYPEALKNYSLALTFDKENKNSAARVYHNISGVYSELKDYKKAAEYISLAIPLKEAVGDKEGISSSYYSLGLLYVKTGKADAAIELFKKSAEIATSIGNKDNIRWNYLGLKEAYTAKKNYEEALKYSTLYDLIKDTLYNENNVKQIAEMQTKYETEKKEKENTELKRKTEVQQLEIKNEAEKRKNQLIIGVSLVAFLAASSLFLYNRRKLKQRAQHASELAEEQKLRFKAIIEAEEKERSRIAQELHDGLGQMLSTARLNVAGLEDSIIPEDKEWLEKSLKLIDDACIEVRHISHNMMPSALIRIGLIPAIHELVNNINLSKSLKIDFTTNITESLGTSLDITIYRIVQEILNNMIKHAKADHITMGISKNGNDLIIRMKDNGVGFDTNKLKESKGIGWKNIFSRVSMMDGTIQLDSEPQKGTVVFINLKLKNG